MKLKTKVKKARKKTGLMLMITDRSYIPALSHHRFRRGMVYDHRVVLTALEGKGMFKRLHMVYDLNNLTYSI